MNKGFAPLPLRLTFGTNVASQSTSAALIGHIGEQRVTYTTCKLSRSARMTTYRLLRGLLLIENSPSVSRDSRYRIHCCRSTWYRLGGVSADCPSDAGQRQRRRLHQERLRRRVIRMGHGSTLPAPSRAHLVSGYLEPLNRNSLIGHRPS